MQIRTGLNAGEQVVTSAQFMLDSESKLREAIQKMMEPAGPGCGIRAGSVADIGQAEAGRSVQIIDGRGEINHARAH